MGLQIFNKYILSYPEIQKKTIQGILKLINKEREGDIIDKVLLKNLLRMFVSLQVYIFIFLNIKIWKRYIQKFLKNLF